jgi:hypothetical protein
MGESIVYMEWDGGTFVRWCPFAAMYFVFQSIDPGYTFALQESHSSCGAS